MWGFFALITSTFSCKTNGLFMNTLSCLQNRKRGGLFSTPCQTMPLRASHPARLRVAPLRFASVVADQSASLCFRVSYRRMINTMRVLAAVLRITANLGLLVRSTQN